MEIRCSCGHKFEAENNPSLPEVKVVCPSCSQELRIINRDAVKATMSPAEIIASKLRRHEVISGLLWLLLGIVQIVFIYTAAAGIWNIVNAIRQLLAVNNIQAGNPEVIKAFDENKTSLFIAAIINLLLGAVIGVVLVLFDLWIRDYVMKNKSAFKESPTTSDGN